MGCIVQKRSGITGTFKYHTNPGIGSIYRDCDVFNTDTDLRPSGKALLSSSGGSGFTFTEADRNEVNANVVTFLYFACFIFVHLQALSFQD